MERSTVLLVHGIDARDDGAAASSLWGRIPAALRDDGRKVLFGAQDAWGTAESNGRQLGAAICAAAEASADGKVVVVAHSKGGIDCLEACRAADVAEKVSALITLSTPHRGMAFCDGLLRSRAAIPVASRFVDAKARFSGDAAPDSMGALACLSTRARAQAPAPRVKLISVGFDSLQPKGAVARVVARTDGPNDGLVPLASTRAGDWRIAATVDPGASFLHTDCTDDCARDIPLESNGTVYPSITDLILALVRETEIP